MAPIIVFIHGFWETPEIFEPVVNLLSKAGYATDYSHRNPSLGTTSPGNPSMEDDIAAIHKYIEKLADAGHEILLVLHSAAGFLGSNGIEGLLLNDRKSAGKPGGVYKIVFIAGAVFPVGFTHGDLPFAKIEAGSLLCTDPENIFFNDLEPAEAKRLAGTLLPHPSAGWNGTVTYAGWQHVPSVYIVCKRDACIPPALQEQLAATANSRVERVDGGHLAVLSRPEEVAGIIRAAARGV